VRFRIQQCEGPIHFEGHKFQDEEDVGQGDEGVEAGGGCFGEKAPGMSFVGGMEFRRLQQCRATSWRPS